MNPTNEMIKQAYRAGSDYRANGANETNCAFNLFLHPLTTLAWEQGNKGEALTVRHD